MRCSRKEIEGLYLKTMQGTCPKACANSKGRKSDAEEFYQNQLGEFTAGLERCLKQLNAQQEKESEK